MKIVALVVGGWLLAPSTALAWGLAAHRELTQHMQDALPTQSCLRQFSESLQTQSFQIHSGDPDAWRDHDAQEAPRHFLDIDVHTPAKDYPRDWPEVYALYGKKAEGYGLVPWHVETMYAELVAAFANQNGTKLKQMLPWFSHYVMDAFSPLHNTLNYDPNGLHYRYEDVSFEVSNNLATIMELSRGYTGLVGRAHPKHHLFDIVLVGTDLVNPLISADNSAISGSQWNATTFFNRTKDLTARRFGDAITLFSSLLASAWVDAGKPTLSGMQDGCDMDVPQGKVILAGYPVPGGFTYVEPKEDVSSQPTGCNAGLMPIWAIVALGALARRRKTYTN